MRSPATMRTVDKLRAIFGSLVPLAGAWACSPSEPHAVGPAETMNDRSDDAGARADAFTWPMQVMPLDYDSGAPGQTRIDVPVPAMPPMTPIGKVPVFAQTLCAKGTTSETRYEPLQGLVLPGARPDYVALRRTYGDDLQEVGWRCAHATSRDACERGLNARFPGDVAPADSIAPSFLLVQRGDQITPVATWTQLKAFLGPVDTLQKAALHVALHRHPIVCGFSTGEKTKDGWLLTAKSEGWCGYSAGYVLHVATDGTFTVRSSVKLSPDTCQEGRRPAGYRTPARAAADLGSTFARSAELEAASVTAFTRIARELSVYGAPESLVRRAKRACRDEVRHARMMRRLARRFGGEPQRRRALPVPPRSLFSFALDNALEGCVRETYGALVAHERAARAGDSDVARSLRIVARDETRHSALSWDMAAWVESKLTDAERLQLRTRQHQELRDLVEAEVQEPSRELQQLAGMPTVARMAELLQGLGEHLLGELGV